jgi:DNA-binding response OmpR family regulator
MAEPVGARAGTILIVNKRLLPLKEIVATLKVANFVVLQAESEGAGVALAARHAGSIDLLLADSELLGMAYLSLADTLCQTRPDFPVMLFCGEVVIGSFGCALIQNPCTPAALMEMINAALHPGQESQVARAGSGGSAMAD